MKKSFVVLAIFISLMVFPSFTYATTQSTTEIPSQWQIIFEDSPIEANEFKNYTFSELFTKFVDTVKYKIKAPMRLFMQITALIILSSMVRGVCPTIKDGTITSLLDTIITLAVFGVCSIPILELVENMINTLQTTKSYLSAFVPVFASVLASCGQFGSATVYSGFFFSTIMMIANFLCAFGLPSIKILFSLSILDGVCNVLDFSKIMHIFIKIAKWSLSICASIFIVIIGLQGSIANVADTVAVKTGKLILGATVPIIGRAISDAVGSVYAGLKLFKGTAGVALVGIIAVSFLPILIEAAIYYIVLNLSAMVASLTGNEPSSKLFYGMSEGINLSILFIFFFCVMTILSTIMMILVGGGG